MSYNRVKRESSFGDLAAGMWAFETKSFDHLSCRNITFQVTDDCSLACSYCYQHNKGKRYMTIDTAKAFIDTLIKEDNHEYEAIVIDFIGGEPFLAVDLISDIMDYWNYKMILHNHRWAGRYRISICTNGMHNTNPNVQEFIRKHSKNLSLTVTIDGDKELHDSCRRTPNGEPSYDLAKAASQDYKDKYGLTTGTKVTIAPANLIFLFHSIKHFIEQGEPIINANCVFEEGWTNEDGKEFYQQLKRLADFIIDNGYYNSYISLFEDRNFQPMREDDNLNWCGGDGQMLAIDPDGNLYPCLRYMESSLGEKQPPIRCGDAWNGVDEDSLAQMRTITRRSQSTDECFNCPIATGCAWCTAYNYEVFGTIDKRATFICPMHKSRALANVYYWNKLNNKLKLGLPFTNFVPKEWALDFIDEKEWELLKDLEEKRC